MISSCVVYNITKMLAGFLTSPSFFLRTWTSDDLDY